MKESGKLECTLMESFILREKVKYNQYGLIAFETFDGIINCYIEETSDFIAICSYIVKGPLRKAVVVQCINLFVDTTHKRMTQIFLNQDVPNTSIPLKAKVKVTLFSSVQFSRSAMSDSLRPHESQHAGPPCPSPTPRVHSNSCPSSWWCHPADSMDMSLSDFEWKSLSCVQLFVTPKTILSVEFSRLE